VRLNGVDIPGGLGVTKVLWSASGATSGDATVNGDETTIPVANEGVTQLSVRSRDAAGNEAAARRVFVRLDFSSPTIDVRTPAEGATVTAGPGAVADFSCNDAGSGIDTCDGNLANGARLDSGGLGEKTLTVVALDRSGRRTEVSRHYTVVAADDGPAADKTAPTLSASLTNRRFRVGRAKTATSAAKKKKKAPLGTKFRIRLSEPAAYRISIQKLTRGVKAGKRCVKPSKKHRRGKKCTIASGAGTLSRSGGRAGLNSVVFSGRVGKKALKPGSYRANVTATDAAGNRSKQKTVTFTVVK
jgi:hypothetical protein